MPQNNLNKKQNPLRALFLSLSRMPPAVMLLIVIGLAVLITMIVSDKVIEEENLKSQQKPDLAAAQDDSSNSRKRAYYSATMIPQGSTIERKQIRERNVNELELWDDAVPDVTSIVGRKPKKDIPLNAQIRQIDLESVSQ
jgi:hypothetical protein